MQFVDFNREKARRLRDRYGVANACHEESFLFEGREWVTGYAYFALLWLANRFNDPSIIPEKLCKRPSQEDKAGLT